MDEKVNCEGSERSQLHQEKNVNVILLTRQDFPTSTQCRTILVDIGIDQHVQVGSGHHEDENGIFATGSGQ